MARVIVKFVNSTDEYVNIEAEEFHEENGFIKAYQRNELVGMFRIEDVRIAYRSDKNDR